MEEGVQTEGTGKEKHILTGGSMTKKILYTIIGFTIGVALTCLAFYFAGFNFDNRGLGAVSCFTFSMVIGAVGACAGYIGVKDIIDYVKGKGNGTRSRF